MKFKIDKLQAQLNHYTIMLQQERKQNKELQSEKSNYVGNRSELEKLFLECVEEVKKDIGKRYDN